MADEPARKEVDLTKKATAEVAELTPYCEHYAQLMDLLSRRWMGILLRFLMSGPHRFNEFITAIPGISDPVLTQRLRELEARKLVERRVIPCSPVRVVYELTESGKDLERAVRSLSDWASKWWDPAVPANSTSV